MSIVLLLPFVLIRFVWLARLDRTALARAARFAPRSGRAERAAYWVYQLSTAGLLGGLCVLRIRTAPPALFFSGLAVCGAGLALLAGAVASFTAPTEEGFCQRGLYRVSRHPMYLAYFVFFAGCALLTQSPVLWLLLVLFQGSAHWIIRGEERWCIQTFGPPYLRYMARVRRYL